ncbi:P-loop containing nucleoside triphosphate hydrolase protein [Mycena sp. CBHHK59/15]|nr:P-loop containing nucleoside triphosphate hydrolase protein [Mycena sp. CBHHK59/15]
MAGTWRWVKRVRWSRDLHSQNLLASTRLASDPQSPGHSLHSFDAQVLAAQPSPFATYQPLRSAPDPMPNTPGSKPNLLHSLRKLYGPTADWRDPKQYKAVRELLAFENDVIVALKTGGGKTPVAILPSMVENGYTVIILPLVSLMADWERRLVKLRLLYERYLGAKGPQDLHGRHNLILVSSDVAKHGRWTQAIMQLHSGKKPVLRYVMDEVAYYFSDYDFRTSLVDPFALRAELFLQKQFMLVNPTRLSSLSERAELWVIIEKPCSDFAQQITVAKQRISDITQKSGWAPRHLFLVFVRRTEDGQHAAKALGLPFYHAGIKEEEREKMYSNWVAGLTPGIVATTALGAGTDYPNVLFTIHLGPPFDLVTFEQQRGRAARGPGTRGRNF